MRKLLWGIFIICVMPLLYGEMLNPTSFITRGECIKKRLPLELLLRESASEQFILQLEHGKVVDEGNVLTAGGELFADAMPFEPIEWYIQEYQERESDTRTYFSGRLVVLSSFSQHQWYHWLLQVIPRLKILAESGVEYDKIYLNNLKYSWQKESLAIIMQKLNIPADRLLVVDGDTIIEAKKLIVPSLAYTTLRKNNKILPVWLKEFMKTTFLQKDSVPGSKKIYISRSKAKVRKILNETDLIDFLKIRGFEILNLEELSVLDQARYFHDADVIIGPHGSGFANLIFCRSNTVCVEIDHYGENSTGRRCFKDMARDMNCHYNLFYVDSTVPAHMDDDFSVDLKLFENFFHSLSI